MANYQLTREEQETIIRSYAASRTWDICTADPKIIRKMKRQGYVPDDRPNPWGYVSFTVPYSRVTIRRAEKRKATGNPFQKHAISRVPRTELQIPIVG